MKCPFCGHGELSVVDVNPADQDRATRRRRECLGCSKRFNTFERVEGAERRPVSRHRTRHAARHAQGKCHDCPAEREADKARCAGCAEIHRIKDRARYAERKSEVLKEGCAG
jgi:hypothetical protein